MKVKEFVPKHAILDPAKFVCMIDSAHLACALITGRCKKVGYLGCEGIG